ncbi:hypothetical protein ACFSR7_33075 [Cohnella sp. GCM10020058]|uniref:hypothetical protein n=1 Tax=Cohnella sp. GCM10020058 TaxID=3317330 RepID=UPI0036324C99
MMERNVSEEVTKLTTEGKNLLVNGGPGLGSTLAQLDLVDLVDLVDEYHFLHAR